MNGVRTHFSFSWMHLRVRIKWSHRNAMQCNVEGRREQPTIAFNTTWWVRSCWRLCRSLPSYCILTANSVRETDSGVDVLAGNVANVKQNNVVVKINAL